MPDPLEFGHSIMWGIGVDRCSYHNEVQHFNGLGIFVYYTPANVSVLVVEGRPENSGKAVFCRANDENQAPVQSNKTAVIQFYGEQTPTSIVTMLIVIYCHFHHSCSSTLLYSPGPPVAPGDLSVNTTAPLTVLLSWQPSLSQVGENVSHQLLVYPSTGGSVQTIATNVTGTSHVFNFPERESCKEYTFVVRAVNLAGSKESAPLNTVIPDG